MQGALIAVRYRHLIGLREIKADIVQTLDKGVTGNSFAWSLFVQSVYTVRSGYRRFVCSCCGKD